ncbi:MAG: polysaccharide biosynthesis C-terminal domain-containing protein, partial [Clostridia bacterium]|nr:polysaccharide biosynthesis C-terminal domain-containing protein [Clostridia bacterium]
GVPLAYTLSSFSACGFLLIKMRKKIGSYGGESVKNLIVSAISALCMGVAVWLTNGIMPNFDGIIGRVINLGVPVLAGVIVYGVCSIIFRNPIAMKVLKRGQ